MTAVQVKRRTFPPWQLTSALWVTSTSACSRSASSSSARQVDDQSANLICAQLLLLAAEEPEQGHLPLHQLARRLGHRRPRHLRHDAVRQLRRVDRVPGPRGVDGPVPAVRRRARQALRPAALAASSCTSRRARCRARRRHRHPGRADHLPQAHDGRAHRLPHRPAVERIEADSDRDRWFTAEEAKEYGFIDKVIEKATLSDLPLNV